MNPWLNHMQKMTRRQLFQQAGMGMGGAALGSLLAEDLGAAVENGGLHFAPKAKRVIYIHLVGAPSHLDLFDHKPMLQKHHGELCPDEFFVGKQLAFIREQPTLLGTPQKEGWGFKRCGQSGIPISNLFF